MVPADSRMTSVQFDRPWGSTVDRPSALPTTHEPISSPTRAPRDRSVSWKRISSPAANGRPVGRTGFVGTRVNGLNVTSKVNVLDLPALGTAVCGAAAIETTPTKPSNKARAPLVRASSHGPPPGCRSACSGPTTVCGEPYDELSSIARAAARVRPDFDAASVIQLQNEDKSRAPSRSRSPTYLPSTGSIPQPVGKTALSRYVAVTVR
jgi:hypothetical protein